MQYTAMRKRERNRGCMNNWNFLVNFIFPAWFYFSSGFFALSPGTNTWKFPHLFTIGVTNTFALRIPKGVELSQKRREWSPTRVYMRMCCRYFVIQKSRVVSFNHPPRCGLSKVSRANFPNYKKTLTVRDTRGESSADPAFEINRPSSNNHRVFGYWLSFC